MYHGKWLQLSVGDEFKKKLLARLCCERHSDEYKNDVNHKLWPLQSPDLNLIVYGRFWSEVLDSALLHNHQHTTKAELSEEQ